MATMKRAVLLLLLAGLLSSSLPFKAESVEGLSQPYFFALALWEGEGLLAKAVTRLQALTSSSLPPEGEVQLVKEYFLEDKSVDPRLVERVIERHIGQILRREGLSFPPILFRLERPPHLLIVSPRERMELTKTVLLRQELLPSQIEELERQVEGLGVSALVERLGGVAAYPSLVPASSLESTIKAAVHEWFHHYLFFRPLGWNYGRSQEVTTINESVAEMAAEEVVSRLLSLYQVEKRVEKPVLSSFDFNGEMRQIRLQAEEYLARGEIDQAEQFMEERRQFLAGKGYHLRRLNQAYFAYHGLYVDSPGFVSPIGQELKRLRQASPSLGEFIRKVAGVSNYQELKRLIATAP